jgi:hypothetical protein
MKNHYAMKVHKPSKSYFLECFLKFILENRNLLSKIKKKFESKFENRKNFFENPSRFKF